MIPLTRTASASRRKSTSPSIPRLRNNPNMSILSFAIVVLMVSGFYFLKDDAVASFILAHPLCYTTLRDTTAKDMKD